MSELSKLRHHLAKARKTGKRTAPLALRIEIGKAAIRLRDEQGLSRERLAAQLGMSKATLNSWVDLARSAELARAVEKHQGSRILPVEVEVEDVSELTNTRSVSVRLPSGMLAEGLSVIEVAALEKALS